MPPGRMPRAMARRPARGIHLVLLRHPPCSPNQVFSRDQDNLGPKRPDLARSGVFTNRRATRDEWMPRATVSAGPRHPSPMYQGRESRTAPEIRCSREIRTISARNGLISPDQVFSRTDARQETSGCRGPRRARPAPVSAGLRSQPGPGLGRATVSAGPRSRPGRGIHSSAQCTPRKSSSVSGVAVSSGSCTGSPGNSLASKNQRREAGMPHSWARRRLLTSQRMGSSSRSMNW